jgi:hypothetical protein
VGRDIRFGIAGIMAATGHDFPRPRKSCLRGIARPVRARDARRVPGPRGDDARPGKTSRKQS